MDETKTKFASLLDALSGLLCLAWFVFPLPVGPVTEIGAPEVFTPYLMPVVFLQREGLNPYTVVLLLLYLIPLFSTFRILSMFIPSRLGRFAQPEHLGVSAVRVFITIPMIITWLVPLIRYADSFEYFKYLIPFRLKSFASNKISDWAKTSGKSLYSTKGLKTTHL